MKRIRTPQRHRADRTKPKSKFQLHTVSVSEEMRPKLKAVTHEAALAAVAEFPKTLELVKEQLRKHDPIGIMACFASYGLMTTVGVQGQPDQNPLKDISQHHVELLQAIMLTIPRNEWGWVPVVPDVMQIIFDSMPRLSDAFFLQRTLDAEKVADEQELTVLSLQTRIRMHTMGVRNWGYFGDVLKISKELYGAIDAVFAAHHGFSCTDLIEVVRFTVGEFERRQTEHWNKLRNFYRGRNPRQIFRLYFKYVPGLVGSAEEMPAALAGVDVASAKAMVMAHYDLRLADCATFKPDEIAELSGRSRQVVENIFQAISLAPGSLAAAKTDYMFLDNPIWEAPCVALGDSFFAPMPQAVFSHIHRIMERLASAAGAKGAVEKARSIYLQNKLESTLRSALPRATITPGAKWKIGDQEFETDVLVTLDRLVIAAEAKSNRLTPEGLRGAPARVRRHVRDMVLDPSVQSERLANLIANAQAGDVTAIATVKGLGIDQEAVDRVIRLSVTLDDLSVLSAAEGEFKKVGWVPVEHELAPTMLISDLMCVVDILDKPLLLLHYLSERTQLQKAFNLVGDELDFLGLYLETGFNISDPEKDMWLATSGMSEPIDRYYMGRDAGITRRKPKPNLTPLFTKIIDRLNERRPAGWTAAGIHLLGAASPSEQRRLEQSLDKLRAMVRKNYRDPAHINSVQLRPAHNRKVRVGFYLFPEQLRAECKKNTEQLATEALNADDIETIVLFARCTEKWNVPYERAVYARKS